MDIISIVALGVGVVALGVPFTIEAVKRPRLKIAPTEWRNPVFVPWTFATVRVYNEPVGALLKNLLARQSAHGCRAEIDYYLWDSTARFLTVPGRWSSLPEPLRFVPSSQATAPPPPGGRTVYPPVDTPVSGGTAPTTFSYGLPASGAPALPVIQGSSGTASEQSAYRVVYDPSRDSGQCDIAVSDEGEQIAVAILREDKAFAFSTESYKYTGWENPSWRLELGKTYRIVVRVRGSGIQLEQAFKLEYLTNNPSEFRLQEIE
jgi:hypothetical protein